MATITFKVTLSEARELRRRAGLQHQTVSAFLRSVALARAKPPQQGLKVRPHPVSGLPVPSKGGRKMSQSQIDAALAEFP
jgi:hypothetical protein